MDLALHWTGVWPDHLQPLLTALKSLPETAHAPEGAVVFCPDAVALAPPAATGMGLVAGVPHLEPLLGTGLHGVVVSVLGIWADRGALFTVSTSSCATTLRALLNLPSERVRIAPLPLPPNRTLAPPEEIGEDILALSPIPYDLVLTATSLLRTAGFEPRLLLAATDAERVACSGGRAVDFGLLPGREVVAVSDWRVATASAGVILLGNEDFGSGWTLREALATGRPVVAPSSPWIRDHLAAIGASVYSYNSLRSLVSSLAGALRRDRGKALESAAREAVLSESWERVARVLYATLLDAIAPVPAPANRAPAAFSPGTVEIVRQPLHVCVMNPNANVGGGETFMHQLVMAMASHESRPRVKLVCQVQLGMPFDPRTDTLAQAGVQTRIVSQANFAVAVSEETDRSDVVYYSWPQGSDPPSISTPLVCTMHDLYWKHFDVYAPEQSATFERQVKQWIERARAVVHSSKFICDEFHQYYTALLSLTHVIPTAADPPTVPTTEEERDYVRRRFALPERFLLSPNGAHRNKNYPALDSALRMLRRDGRRVTVIATGIATEFFNGPDLVGLGYLTAREVHALYDQCDGVVQTTLYEAGSFPLLEAMVSGKPVAISRIPPIVEQIERVGVVAELFDPLDPEDVAEAIWRLWVGSPATEPDILAENARAVGARTWHDVAGDYLKLFAELSN